MLRRLQLTNFRGFRGFTTRFDSDNVLIGPNNAGKSTIVAALRAADGMIRHARSRNPTKTWIDRERRVQGYPIPVRNFVLELDSLRYNSIDAETRLDLYFDGGRSLHASWPPDGSDDGGFFLKRSVKASTTTAGEARTHFPQLGVVPQLAPVETDEALVAFETARDNLWTRRASRNFRNQLRYVAELSRSSMTFESFRDFATPWLPEIALTKPAVVALEDGSQVVLHYFEGLSLRELAWAGDGVQVFLQLLFHCYLLRNSETLIIDEPDVYLHADLQRRLWRMLEQRAGQTIVTTHSTEIASEAAPRATVWIDKSRADAIRPSTKDDGASLVAALGSQFNIRLATALRASVALFVEGEDLKLLRLAATAAGADRLIRESEIAVVPILGSDNWRRLEGFAWLHEDFLQKSVTAWLLLDRDYKSEEYVKLITDRLGASGLKVHVWSRHEIESYALDYTTLAASVDAPIDWITPALDEITMSMRERVVTGLFNARWQEPVPHDRDPIRLRAACEAERDGWWPDPLTRLHRCPAKEVLAALNQMLQLSGMQPVSARQVFASLRAGDMPAELRDVLRSIDAIA